MQFFLKISISYLVLIGFIKKKRFQFAETVSLFLLKVTIFGKARNHNELWRTLYITPPKVDNKVGGTVDHHQQIANVYQVFD
jgi:hypothetical protein